MSLWSVTTIKMEEEHLASRGPGGLRVRSQCVTNDFTLHVSNTSPLSSQGSGQELQHQGNPFGFFQGSLDCSVIVSYPRDTLVFPIFSIYGFLRDTNTLLQ